MSVDRIFSASFRYICLYTSRRLTPSLRRAYSSQASQASQTSHDIYDIVCVGGGPAGLSLLTSIRSNQETSHLRVALVEAQDFSTLASFSPPEAYYSNRCSSLTPTSHHHLLSIGALRHMDISRIQSFQEMQVWEAVTGARIDFNWKYVTGHGKTIAYMAENLNIMSGLLKRLTELGDVTLLDNSRVEKITLGQDTKELDLSGWPVVHLDSGKTLVARLLVGADGANSPVRSFAGIESRGWDYNQHAVVATVKIKGFGWGRRGHKIAYQRFLPTGPIALLPMPGMYSTLVWSTTPENAALLKQLPSEDFITLVNAGFRLAPNDIAFLHSLASEQLAKQDEQPAEQQNEQPAEQSESSELHDIGKLKTMQEEYEWRLRYTSFEVLDTPQMVVGVQANSVASFPLKMRHTDSYIEERVALVGDAAHTIHPLAGQGLNQGQADIMSLFRAIHAAVLSGQDIGTRKSLEPYYKERYVANSIMLSVCDKLARLYSVSSGPFVPLRSIALRALNTLTTVKGLIMGQAAGKVRDPSAPRVEEEEEASKEASTPFDTKGVMGLSADAATVALGRLVPGITGYASTPPREGQLWNKHLLRQFESPKLKQTRWATRQERPRTMKWFRTKERHWRLRLRQFAAEKQAQEGLSSVANVIPLADEKPIKKKAARRPAKKYVTSKAQDAGAGGKAQGSTAAAAGDAPHEKTYAPHKKTYAPHKKTYAPYKKTLSKKKPF